MSEDFEVLFFNSSLVANLTEENILEGDLNPLQSGTVQNIAVQIGLGGSLLLLLYFC